MANQYKVDPRQALFLSYYLDPKSETFSNALQSALRAGYEQEYAENITSLMPDWLSESIAELNMVHKAEKNLNNIMELPVTDDKYIGHVAKVSMFVAERLNKKKYAARTELTGKDGEALPTPIYSGKAE